MRAKHQLLTLAVVALLTCGAMAGQDQPLLVPISEDRPSLEFVGQFINSGTSSQQFGYLSNIRGLNQILLRRRKMKPRQCSPSTRRPQP